MEGMGWGPKTYKKKPAYQNGQGHFGKKQNQSKKNFLGAITHHQW